MAQDNPALRAIRERIQTAKSEGTALCIRGYGSKDFYGQAATGDELSTRDYSGIVSYEPTELVITVRAGTRLQNINEALAESGQMLPFEPPQFAEHASIGGVVASGLSGPARASAGAVRDFVLGTKLINSHGEWLSFGGQVMKNVAGYDVSRLLCGSMGILGLIAEVSLKVLPLPVSKNTFAIDCDQQAGLDLINRLGGQPLPITASSWQDDRLLIRLAGSSAALDSASKLLLDKHGASIFDAGDIHWQTLRDHQQAIFSDTESNTPLWRLSVPSTAARFNFPGEQLIEWGGALRWWRTDVDAAIIREAANNVGGTASLFRGGDKSVGVFEPLSEPIARIHQRLKDEFDPTRLFNPGRLYPDL